MGWKQNGLGWGAILPRVSAQPTWWMDAAEYRGIVGQRKLFSVVTGKRNTSKVSPRLGWWQHSKSEISLTMVNDGMVVKTSGSHRSSHGSSHRGSHIYSVFSQQNWRVGTMGSGITRLCDGDVSWLL